MADLFKKIVEFIRSTKIPEQLNEVDLSGLLHNTWFMVPFVFICIYLLYKKEFAVLAISAICIGGWYLTGTDYMSNLIVGGEIQISKILPVVFGGAVALIAIVYLLLNRE